MSSSERLRGVSVRVFGNRYRVELMLALASADDRGVCLGDLADVMRAPASVYQAPMKSLMDAGFAERLSPVPGERRRWYRRSGPAALWERLADLLECLSEVTEAVQKESTAGATGRGGAGEAG